LDGRGGSPFHRSGVFFTFEDVEGVGIDREPNATERVQGGGLPVVGEGDVSDALAGLEGVAALDVSFQEAAGPGGGERLAVVGAEFVARINAGPFGQAPLHLAGFGGEQDGGTEAGEEDRPGGEGFVSLEGEGGVEAYPGGRVFELARVGSPAGDDGADGGVGIAAEGRESGVGTGELADRPSNAMRRLGGVKEALHLPGGERKAGNSGVPVQPAGGSQENGQKNTEGQACSVARGFGKLRCSMKLLFVIAMVCLPAPAQTAAQTALPAEKLSFKVEWRMVNAGTAMVTTNTTPTGTFLQMHLHSAGLVSRLFRVNDNYTVTLNETLCAQSSKLQAEEGEKRRETTVVWRGNRSRYEEKDLLKGTMALERELEVSTCVHDILGALTVLRKQTVEMGQDLILPVSDGKKFVQARIQAQEKERIRTPAGQFNAIRYEAFLFNDVIYKREARLFVWISDDGRRLPVQIQVRMKFHIGTVTLQLDKVEP